MVKEFIGSSKVRNGIAADWFVLEKNLPKGCYQLIAEYLGNSMYKPSYDVKKLIVGWYTEIRNLKEYYVVDLSTRKLVVSGTLVGTDDENGITYLANRKIGFKIRPVAPPDMHPFEQLLDAKVLYNENGDEYAYTDANGNFSFEVYFPTNLEHWKYSLLVTFGGDYDYIMCSEVRPVYMGDIPTRTIVSVAPGNHIRNDGACILTARTYSYEYIGSDGELLGNAQPMMQGNISWFTSTDNRTWKRVNIAPESLERDGMVEHRMQFDYDPGETHELYIRAKYGGTKIGNMGYRSSDSNSVHLTIDEYGDSANLIRMQLQDLVVDQKTIYYVVDEIQDKKLTFDYGDEAHPVPLGECVVTAKKVV